FGNENYLLHTVEDAEGEKHTYYWNPDAIINWRQRKKAMRQNGDTVKSQETPAKPKEVQADTEIEPVSHEQIPIGTKLDILDTKLTNDEQISELNMPVSDLANRLEHNQKQNQSAPQTETAHFHGTPIAEMPKIDTREKTIQSTRYHVVEKQLSEKQADQPVSKCDRRHVQNPIEQFKTALHDAWQIPCLQQDLIKILGENSELMKAIVQSPQMERQAHNVYTAAKAETDEIEAQRIALLVELDKVKTDYQQIKEKMLKELTQKKQDELTNMEQQLLALKMEKNELEMTLSQLGNQMQQGAAEFVASKSTMMIASNGSDLTISPTVGFHFAPPEIVEIIRAEMNALGFMCNQDCVTEFLIHLSLFDEIAVQGKTLCVDELYVTSIIQAMGLGNVTAWPNVFGTINLVSLLPENDLRTPTIEIVKNDRTPIRAYGHKTIRFLDKSYISNASLFPIIQVPMLNKEIRQDRIANHGKPVSLQTLHSFSQSSIPLSGKGETWFDQLSEALESDNIHISGEILHAMRMFARIASPQLVGGFMEAADAAVMAWIIPILLNDAINKEQTMQLISDLPRSRNTLQSK
ncbi:MAG TPA: hypothetical protein PK537_07855, partial [Candidatus Limiplasma sp.]|nr:hypothetical protein [Candidatus Limiplasma sp.]